MLREALARTSAFIGSSNFSEPASIILSFRKDQKSRRLDDFSGRDTVSRRWSAGLNKGGMGYPASANVGPTAARGPL